MVAPIWMSVAKFLREGAPGYPLNSFVCRQSIQYWISNDYDSLERIIKLTLWNRSVRSSFELIT
jgi:hypothetical protein